MTRSVTTAVLLLTRSLTTAVLLLTRSLTTAALCQAVAAGGGASRLTVIGPGRLRRWLKTWASVGGEGEWEFVSGDRIRAGREWVTGPGAGALEGTAAEMLGVRRAGSGRMGVKE